MLAQAGVCGPVVGGGLSGSVGSMSAMELELDAIASETGFSGVVRVDTGDRIELARAYGLAHRAFEIPNEVDTRFALASGTKGLTALTVLSLVEDGALELATTARSILGKDLPLVGDGVTVEHLLAQRSGIGDYLDEELGLDIDAYLMPVPVHELATTDDYLAVLGGHPPKFAPDERFAYSNSGYVVLALIAERVSGTSFHELVQRRVCEPAGMHDTAFLWSDELPARTARGYLEGNDPWRTNVFHLPVRGSGDGGIFSTAQDVRSFWAAFFAGRIVSSEWVEEAVLPRSEDSSRSRWYGLGFWLHASTDTVLLVGMDSGVSFSSMHVRQSNVTCTVLSNTSHGAWPVSRYLGERLGL